MCSQKNQKYNLRQHDFDVSGTAFTTTPNAPCQRDPLVASIDGQGAAIAHLIGSRTYDGSRDCTAAPVIVDKMYHSTDARMNVKNLDSFRTGALLLSNPHLFLSQLLQNQSWSNSNA